MTGGTGFALAALVCYGLADFIYKQATATGIKPHHFLMGQACWFAPSVFLYAWATGTLIVSWPAAWGALAGLFIFVGFYNFLRSLATGSVSINAPIFRLNFIVTVILAVAILREPFTVSLAVALGLSIAAIWLLLGRSDEAPRPEVDRGSLIAILIATAALGAANFFHTIGIRHGVPPETMLASQAVVFVTLSTGFARIVDGAIKPPRRIWTYAGVAALLLVAAFLLMLHALTKGPASVLVPIAQMGFVVTALLGIFVLREGITLRKATGLVAALAALIVLAAA
jgi:drug/metabolite transporter (DMT)-like permease